MPQLGESVVEGTVVRWLKAPGETVKKLEPLLDIATDKIDTEVPSPIDGMVLRVLVAEGETVAAGSILAYIGSPDEALPDSPPQRSDAAPDVKEIGALSDRPVPDHGDGQDTTQRERPRDEVRGGKAFISPVVARIAAQEAVDLANVPGTGLAGRITKKDLLAYMANRSVDQEPAASAEPLARTDSAADRSSEPLTTMRRAIAEHMVRSKQTSAHVTTVHEVDMTAVVRHRDRYRAAYAAKGIALTYTPYFARAAVAGLQAVPALNGEFSDAGIVVNRRIHLGVAVAIEDGLIVPVIVDADERNLAGLARSVNRLSQQARAGDLSPDQLQGGTFTLTNHGVGGSLLSTPIIHQPQAGILGIGTISKRPVVRSVTSSLLPDADDAIVIRAMCYLSLSFDHRAIDGAVADAFMGVVKTTLEQWPEHEE